VFIEAKDDESGGDNWSGAISRAKLQSHHHHQQTPSFLHAGCPSCHPTNSVKALKGKTSHSMDLLTPSSSGGLPTLSLTTNGSWLPSGRVAMPLISALMPVPHFTVKAYINIIIFLQCFTVKALKEIYNIPWTCSPQAHLGVFQRCLLPLTVTSG